MSRRRDRRGWPDPYAGGPRASACSKPSRAWRSARAPCRSSRSGGTRRSAARAEPRASAATRLSVSSSTPRPSTRQLISQVSIEQSVLAVSRRPIDDGDDAVVAELVEQADLQRERGAGRRSARRLRSSVMRRVVRLNWLVLLMSCTMRGRPIRVEPAPTRLHVEAAQIAVEVGRRSLHAAARSAIGLVLAARAADPRRSDRSASK